MVAPGFFLNTMEDQNTNTKQDETPVKNTRPVPTHKTFDFNHGTKKEDIDKEINDWIVTETKAGTNPMVYKYAPYEHGLYVFCLHTTKIEMD